MSRRQIIRKYARGLARALENEKEFEVCYQQLKALAALMSASESIKFALISPFVAKPQKKKIVEEILKRSGLTPKANRLVELLVENEKINLLPEILAELPEVWAEEQGVETFEISSAVELTEEEKSQLKKILEEREKKPVRLLFRLNPEIIGGLVLRKGSIYYDVSVKGGLLKLKEIVSQG